MLCVFGYSLSLLTQTFWATVGFSSFTVFSFHAAHLAFCLYFVSYYKRKMIYLEVNPETLTGSDFNVTFDQSGDDR